jgi:hypothetical protein
MCSNSSKDAAASCLAMHSYVTSGYTAATQAMNSYSLIAAAAAPSLLRSYACWAMAAAYSPQRNHMERRWVVCHPASCHSQGMGVLQALGSRKELLLQSTHGACTCLCVVAWQATGELKRCVSCQRIPAMRCCHRGSMLAGTTSYWPMARQSSFTASTTSTTRAATLASP